MRLKYGDVALTVNKVTPHMPEVVTDGDGNAIGTRRRIIWEGSYVPPAGEEPPMTLERLRGLLLQPGHSLLVEGKGGAMEPLGDFRTCSAMVTPQDGNGIAVLFEAEQMAGQREAIAV